MRRELIILRGLPGSGKSHRAREIGGTVCSADDFFMEGGVYKFDPSKLGEAHAQCQAKAIQAMAGQKSPVVIDNTNSRRWEFSVYSELASAFGYNVKIRTVGGRSMEEVKAYAARGKHGVPEEVLLKMAYRWEE